MVRTSRGFQHRYTVSLFAMASSIVAISSDAFAAACSFPLTQGVATQCDSLTVASGQTGAINNSGTIGPLGGGVGGGITVNGSITSLTNNLGGLIIGSGNGLYNNTNIDDLQNSGTITGTQWYAIVNYLTARIGNISNSSTGIISGGDIGIDNKYALPRISNYGSITGTANAGILNADDGVTKFGVISILDNFSGGTISGSGGIKNTATITELNNFGTIRGTVGSGIANTFFTGSPTPVGLIVSLNNNAGGSIIGVSEGIFNAANITTITNSGTISGTSAAGINNRLGASITNLINNPGAAIYSGSVGIRNLGSITNLTNAQGGDGSSASTTALRFSGGLPSNYYIYIASASNYGQINFSGPLGSTHIGITSGGFLKSGTYQGVITGITSANLQNLSGVYGYQAWKLISDAATPTTWSLVVGPDSNNSGRALVANQNTLRSLLSRRSSAIMMMMDYDCETFDGKGYCVSFRARYTAMQSQNEGAGVFTAAYRASEKVRIGGFVDYRATEKDGTGLKQGDTMPTVGAFAAYSQSGNATGFQAKASAAYNSGRVTVTRASSVTDNTEAGSAKAGLNSYAIGAELGWGFAVSPNMFATPYTGVRYSDATRNSYTEATVAGVDFPISYDTYYQRLTTATVGMRLSGMLSDNVGYLASLGGEYDLMHKASTYSGTSAISSLETFALANTGSSNRARINASAGLFYQLDKTQRLTATVGVRGQAYSSQPSVMTLIGYQAAF